MYALQHSNIVLYFIYKTLLLRIARRHNILPTYSSSGWFFARSGRQVTAFEQSLKERKHAE
jgi:hypothetical protein